MRVVPELLTQELMNISFQRKTDLAFAVMRTLAEAERRLSGADLAREVGTTLSYLPQIVSPLIAAGWISSGRGPGGGYELTEAASGVHLLDVVEVTEGPAESGRCVLRDAPCPGETQCGVHAVWAEARHVLLAGLARIPVG
jgi:Rrf2 family transcriptional regulator, iron-sulfur cluster assembly transcription factor